MDEIKLEVPMEPPRLSVVLDRLDVAWQRIGSHWYRANYATFEFIPPAARAQQLDWPSLLVHRGPVRVLHWAPVAEKSASR